MGRVTNLRTPSGNIITLPAVDGMLIGIVQPMKGGRTVVIRTLQKWLSEARGQVMCVSGA